MKLIFDRSREELVILNHVCVWRYRAANNVDSHSRGPWPNGAFTARQLIPVAGKNGKPNGSFGPWFLLFEDFPDRDMTRTGMGLHSGRANKGGHEHPTYGCIRVEPLGMKKIAELMGGGEVCEGLWVL